jgi:hypothetical protein
MATSPSSLSELLRTIPPVVRPTVQAARRTVKSAAPRATEVVYQSSPPRSPSAMWKIVRYLVDEAPVIGIGTYPTYASLFFYRGRELDDPTGLLAGGGKEMRSIRLHAPADVEQPAVKELVRTAFELGGTPTRSRRS